MNEDVGCNSDTRFLYAIYIFFILGGTRLTHPHFKGRNAIRTQILYPGRDSFSPMSSTFLPQQQLLLFLAFFFLANSAFSLSKKRKFLHFPYTQKFLEDVYPHSLVRYPWLQLWNFISKYRFDLLSLLFSKRRLEIS